MGSDRGYWHLDAGLLSDTCMVGVRVTDDIVLNPALLDGRLDDSRLGRFGVWSLRLIRRHHSAEECPHGR